MQGIFRREVQVRRRKCDQTKGVCVDLGAPLRSDKRKALPPLRAFSAFWKGVVNHRWQRAIKHHRRY
jgi:hypothetical protein